jgi:hypothetical protein
MDKEHSSSKEEMTHYSEVELTEEEKYENRR